jgi:Asp-tRNA(Asn)/Glu-tRNA(Gln) amidotransferase A subunit family amidase
MNLFDKNIYEWTAYDISRAVKDKAIQPIEVANEYVDYIHEKDKEVKAWESFEPDIFLESVRNNKNKGSLVGVPIAVKDVFNTIDYPTQMGSKIWEGFTPGNNARVVDHLIWEGANIVGKTVTAEFAVHSPGKTLNPLSKDHIVGTSSSGSAAAVASGMSPIALGTQTAGSTIRPSSYCGIFGYKPSFGIIPRTGILKTLDTLDHICLMARNVKDLSTAMNCARVTGRNHPYIKSTLDQYEKTKSGEGRYKIGFLKTATWDYTKDYTKDAMEQFTTKLDQDKNIIIEEIEFTPNLNTIHDNHNLIYEKALSYYFADEIDKYKDDISSIFIEMTDRGRMTSTKDYHIGLKKQVEHMNEFDHFKSDYDFFITHSVSGEAPKLDDPTEPDDPCLIWTYLHAPAVTIPLFKGPNNMPFGLQLVSHRYNDNRLLEMANYIETKYLEKK